MSEVDISVPETIAPALLPGRPAFTVIRKGNARGSGYERSAQDWYVEPAKAVSALFQAERFTGTIWDPACGQGTIPEIAKTFGYETLGTDLVGRGYGHAGIDFLATTRAEPEDNVVTNPPYHLATEFALHACRVGARRKVAMLVRLAWLEGEDRFKRLFNEIRPSGVLVFRNRISCPPGGVEMKAKGGAVAYCWIVWERRALRGWSAPRTELDWIKA